IEIPSPGFPPKHKLIQEAKNLQSEYDFFYDVMPKSVWISGTNGKTTTTQMATHLLSHIGAVMGGNVGTPLAELNPYEKLWILETSSFTLHYTHKAKPEIYALLPISPDHLSWHGSFDNYVQDKLSVLKRMNE
ncbi:UDP-N-acetylmuramoyl-L-alanine--D-glutamate ligase, partial [Campylobacter jejuni]|nr:UDP-N-acetylmuramoyl-L-alanine--D-glutamate ligase [Campylobacter jejuni]